MPALVPIPEWGERERDSGTYSRRDGETETERVERSGAEAGTQTDKHRERCWVEVLHFSVLTTSVGTAYRDTCLMPIKVCDSSFVYMPPAAELRFEPRDLPAIG